MESYNSVTDALAGLKKRGYTQDFSLQPHCIKCGALDLELHPEKFQVDEYHRFEGMSNTDDNSIVYAISSDDGVKGVLVDAYGMYSENLTEAMVKKLTMRK
jgi:hypothetical protein